MHPLHSLILAGLLVGGAAQAAVLQTLGSGSAVQRAQASADFEANTALLNPWSEGGLRISHNGFANDNGGCGYAGALCVDPGQPYSQAFAGNYFATAGLNAYVSIASEGDPLRGIEFAADSGYLSIHLLWQTWRDGAMTGSGQVALGASGLGGVVGLRDEAGFDEVRVFAFDSASDTSGYSMAAIDRVRAFSNAVPAPASLALAGLALAGLALGRRRG